MKTLNQAIIILAVLVAVGLPCYAQQDTINRQVEVVKAYQPSISDAYRISSMPRIVDTVQYSPVFEYRINSEPVLSKRKVQNLPFVQLGNAPQPQMHKGYLRGGLGNAWTPYGELFFNTPVTPKTDFGFQVMHYSSRPNIKMDDGVKVEAPYSNNLGRIFVKNYFRNAVLDWDLSYNRNRFNYYGRTSFTSPYSSVMQPSPMQDVKQVFNFASAHAALSSMTAANRPNYKFGIDYDYLWNLSGQAAHVGTLNANYDRKLGKNRLSVEALLGYYGQQDIENVYIADSSRNMFNVELAPQIEFGGSSWNLDLGFKVATITANDTTSRYHISPKINFEFYPIKDIMSLFVNVGGNLKSNNYLELIQGNQYVTPTLDARSTNEIISLNGGITGKISTRISYLFDAKYSIVYDQPFYVHNLVNTTAAQTLSNTFGLIYDDVQFLSFGGDVRYSGRALNIGASGRYYMAQMKTIEAPFQMPLFDVVADASYSFNIRNAGDLTVGFDAVVSGPCKVAVLNTTYSPSVETGVDELFSTTIFTDDLKSFVELNFNAQYNLNKQLAFFLRGNNLLNSGYQVYYGYNHQGVNFLVGARYSF